MKRTDSLSTDSSSPPLRVLGIDPGLNITGYGVLERSAAGPKVCEAGVVRGRTRGSLAARLAEIHEGVVEVIAGLKPSVMALEELYSHYERPRTAILMGHARGVICLAAANSGMTIHSYAATQVKRLLTGSGRAPKNQMQNAICREFGLSSPPEPPDVADGKVIVARNGVPMGFINLGRKDLLQPGTMFEVKNPNNPAVKGYATVTRVEEDRAEVALSNFVDPVGDYRSGGAIAQVGLQTRWRF